MGVVDFDLQRIGDFRFETALTEVERLSREEPDRSKRSEAEQDSEQTAWVHESQRAFVAMAAILRSQPKHLPHAASAVRRGSPAASTLGDALSAAGTDEAQAVLVALIRDKSLRPALRYALGVSLVRTERASEGTLKFIIESTGDPFLRELAVLGLGTVSRRLREAGLPERAQRADAELSNLLAQAKDDDGKVRALRGIGNSGQQGAFDLVQPLARDGSVRLRAAAVEALRLMKDPRVDAALASAMRDRDAEVRGAGLNAAEARAPSEQLAQALQGVLNDEKKSGLRGRAFRLAGRWLPNRPELRASLEKIAAADESYVPEDNGMAPGDTFVQAVRLVEPLRAGQSYGFSLDLMMAAGTSIELWGADSACGAGVEQLHQAAGQLGVMCLNLQPTQDHDFVLVVFRGDGTTRFTSLTLCPTGACS